MNLREKIEALLREANAATFVPSGVLADSAAAFSQGRASAFKQVLALLVANIAEERGE